MTVLLPDQRETCCYAWHGTQPSHLLGMRPSLRHLAPGSLSQPPNRQEFLFPGSACRRVVPWGTVSSWAKGSLCTYSLTAYCQTRHPSYKSHHEGDAHRSEFKGLAVRPEHVEGRSANYNTVSIGTASRVSPPGRNPCTPCLGQHDRLSITPRSQKCPE